MTGKKPPVLSRSEQSLRFFDSDSDFSLNCKSKDILEGIESPNDVTESNNNETTQPVAQPSVLVSAKTPIAKKYTLPSICVDESGSYSVENDYEESVIPQNSTSKFDITKNGNGHELRNGETFIASAEPKSRFLSAQYCSTPAYVSTQVDSPSADSANPTSSMLSSTSIQKTPPLDVISNTRSTHTPADTSFQYQTAIVNSPKADETDESDDSPPDYRSEKNANSPKTPPAKNKKSKKEMFFKSTFITVSVLLALSLLFNVLIGANVFKAKGPRRGGSPPPRTIPIYTTVNKTAENYDHIYKDEEVQTLFGDPRLKKVFYGINYNPGNSTYPQCGLSRKQVAKDIATLSQLTTRIRMQSTDCEQVDMILDAIRALDVNVTVSMGLWLDKFAEVTIRQLANMRRILNRYPNSLINSIFLGHEILYRDDLNDRELIGFIEYVREYLERKGVNIPVGTSEVGFKWSPGLASHVDIMGVNIQPFYGGMDVNKSLTWTYDYLMENVLTQRTSRKTEVVLTEIGWPIKGNSLQYADPGLSEVQQFLNIWICPNQNSEIGWYWYEAFDSPWNDLRRENYWGILGSDNKLRQNLTLPTCI